MYIFLTQLFLNYSLMSSVKQSLRSGAVRGFTQTPAKAGVSSRREGGFTLIEFVVIMSIFAVMASVVLFNFSGFSSNISLSNLAHDVALSIRQAQVYGQSGAGSQTSSNIDPAPRGIYFESTGGGYSSTFIFYRDGNADYQYDPGDPRDTSIDEVTIQSGDLITSIETGAGQNNGSNCTDDVTINFKRPDPNPYITCGSGGVDTYALLTLTSPQGDIREVEVFPTGQISVK